LKEAGNGPGEKAPSDELNELLGDSEEEDPFTIQSMAFVVTKDLQVHHFPAKGDPAPAIVMFPEFRPWAHSSNNGLVSVGIMWGTFRFERCEQ
jgi:hypothetical protein